MFKSQIRDLEEKLEIIEMEIEEKEEEVKFIKKDRAVVKAGLKRMEKLQEQLVAEEKIETI